MKRILRMTMVTAIVIAGIPSTAWACVGCLAFPPYYLGFCANTPIGYIQCTDWPGGWCSNGDDVCTGDDENELLPSGELVSKGEAVLLERTVTLGATTDEISLLEAPLEILYASSDDGGWEYFVSRDCRGLIRERVGAEIDALKLSRAVD